MRYLRWIARPTATQTRRRLMGYFKGLGTLVYGQADTTDPAEPITDTGPKVGDYRIVRSKGTGCYRVQQYRCVIATGRGSMGAWQFCVWDPNAMNPAYVEYVTLASAHGYISKQTDAAEKKKLDDTWEPVIEIEGNDA